MASVATPFKPDPSAPVELLSVAETRRLDACAIAAGVSGRSLMEAAGAGIARAALAAAPGAGRAFVLCGPGANGGDGFVAARHLKAAGLEVAAFLLGTREALSGDAALAAADWTGMVAPLADFSPDGEGIVIDALFGAGLTRPLSGAALAAVRRLNAWRGSARRGQGRIVVAADIPSGVEGDSGQALGEAAVCDVTVTFVRRKPSHVLLPGRALCGEVVVVDIGQPEACVGEVAGPLRTVGPAGWRALWRAPAAAGHKYDRGHCLVTSGGATRTGAARLAARAALRIGAGLVSLAAPADALLIAACHLTAVMLTRCDDAAALSATLADPRLNSVALGPAGGVGERLVGMTIAALASNAAVTLDADALTSFENAPERLFAAIRGRAAPTVLTPHEGEFRRLFGDIGGAKTSRAREAARMSGAVVILKGPDSVVACPDGRVAILDFDAPWLATAGSGDVLTGFVAGLLAQGVPAFEAASAAVWIHAWTGRRVGPGLIAEDLPDAAPETLGGLFA